MSAEVARTAPGIALSLGRMTPHDAWLFADALAKTPLLPDAYRNQPASVLWAMEYGRALGLDVVTTITSIHVIKGKPTQSADLMLSRARAAGHRVRIRSERESCAVSVTRADDPEDETVIEWTLEDAVTAGLCELRDGRPFARDDRNRPQPWERFPRAMLRARAVSEAVRAACPEVLHGAIYTPEELGAYVDQDGHPVEAPPVRPQVVHGEPVPQPDEGLPQRRDFVAEAAEAVGVDAVRELWRQARAAGAPEEVLDRIAETAARAAEAVREAALHMVREAAGKTGTGEDELQEAFQGLYGTPLEHGTEEQLVEMLGIVRGSA